MSGSQDAAADRAGPRQNQIVVLAIGTTSEVNDLQDTTNGFANDHYLSRFVRLIADQAMYYYWTDTAGQTADETAVTGANRCDLLPAGECREERPTGRYLTIKAAVAGTIRISIVQANTRDVARVP